jgi:hypothetical protein
LVARSATGSEVVSFFEHEAIRIARTGSKNNAFIIFVLDVKLFDEAK